MTIWERLQEILACAATEIEATGSEVPGHISVQPGAVACDDWCDGQLYVRIIRAWPSFSTFPVKSLESTPCGTRVATQIGLGILRCSSDLAALDWNQDPSAAALTADARQQVCDMGALYRALACCPDFLGGELVVDAYTPLGPQGGCYGGEWTAWLDNELVCPTEGSS